MMSIRTLVPCSKFDSDFRIFPAIMGIMKISNWYGPCDCAPMIDYAGQTISHYAKIFVSATTGKASGAKATQEKRGKRWEVIIPNTVCLVGSIKNTPFEDLYKKRY